MQQGLSITLRQSPKTYVNYVCVDLVPCCMVVRSEMMRRAEELAYEGELREERWLVEHQVDEKISDLLFCRKVDEPPRRQCEAAANTIDLFVHLSNPAGVLIRSGSLVRLLRRISNSHWCLRHDGADASPPPRLLYQTSRGPGRGGSIKSHRICLAWRHKQCLELVERRQRRRKDRVEACTTNTQT